MGDVWVPRVPYSLQLSRLLEHWYSSHEVRALSLVAVTHSLTEGPFVGIVGLLEAFPLTLESICSVFVRPPMN